MFTDILLKFAGMLLDIDSVSILFFFKEPTFPERAPGDSHPMGGSHLAGRASLKKKNFLKLHFATGQRFLLVCCF